MTPEDFQLFLTLCRIRRIATTDAEVATLLGASANSVSRWKKTGTDQTVALACQAVLARLPPFKTEHAF